MEFARRSIGVSYSPKFRALRAAEESRPLSFVDIGEVPESYNIPFTMSELLSVLAICRDGAAGPDGLSYPFLHHFHPTAIEFLLSFFNWVYTSELFCLGISVQSLTTSCLCKLLERMVAKRMVWVPEDTQGLSPFQFGLRRFRSTADPLLRYEHDISAAFENDKFVLAVFYDLQKAYDSTWKRGVFHKLLSPGFCGYLPIFI